MAEAFGLKEGLVENIVRRAPAGRRSARERGGCSGLTRARAARRAAPDARLHPAHRSDRYADALTAFFDPSGPGKLLFYYQARWPLRRAGPPPLRWPLAHAHGYCVVLLSEALNVCV